MRKIRLQKRRHPALNLLLFVFAAAAGALWAWNEPLAERVIVLRYILLLTTALTAFLTPYLIFPDQNLAMLQLANVGGASLRIYLIQKLIGLCWPLIIFFAALLFAEPASPLSGMGIKLLYMAGGTAYIFGLIALSVKRYTRIGEKSQYWKESEKGRKLRVQMADYLKYPIDPGSLPSLLSTIIILLSGSAVLIFGAIAESVWMPFAEIFVYGILLITGVAYFFVEGKYLMRNFLLTDAFYREFFRVNRKGGEEAVEREVHQLWWVPVSIRPGVWQIILQVDRKLPSGRIVAAGHLLVLLIAYQRPEPDFMLLLWAFFAISHHVLIWVSAGSQIMPSWLERYGGGHRAWIVNRTWMQFRWALPLLLGMNLQLFIFGTPGFEDQALVLFIYLLTAFIASLTAGYMAYRDFSTR